MPRELSLNVPRPISVIALILLLFAATAGLRLLADRSGIPLPTLLVLVLVLVLVLGGLAVAPPAVHRLGWNSRW